MLSRWLLVWLVAGWTVSASSGSSLCLEGHLKCAQRSGCQMALQQFLLYCKEVDLRSNTCPETCQDALITLLSTNEGKSLMDCKCHDESCRQTKERIEVCRPHVLERMNNSAEVKCRVAHWICLADTLCSTALKYYHSNCRSMYQGKRCSSKCKNSIHILRRQEKAAPLDSCLCSGREEYDCLRIRRNMERLCFQKKDGGRRDEGAADHGKPGDAARPLSNIAALILAVLTANIFYR